MNLQELSLEQLKALAYDTIASYEQAKRNLDTINNEISLRNQKMSDEQVVETPVEQTEVVEAQPEVVEAPAEVVAEPVEVSVEPSPSATPEEAVAE